MTTVSTNTNKPLIIYDRRVRWVAAVNMAFVVAGIALALKFGSGESLLIPVVFLGLFSLFWIRDLFFGFRLRLWSDGLMLRWQEGKTSGSVPLADIRKILIGARTTRIGDGVMGWTYVRFALRSGTECDLPPNMASGLRAQGWRRLRMLVAHIRTVSVVQVEPVREPDVVLEGWKDETDITADRGR